MAPQLISSKGIGFVLFGFPVTINWFHFLLPGFFLTGIDFGNLAPGVSAIGVVLAYVAAVVIGVLGHELGHAFAARSIGATAEIELIVFGGLTTWSTGREITPKQRLRVSLAGPILGIVLGAVSWLILNALPQWRLEVSIFLDLLTQVALVWGIFNLVPFPGFDGGHSLDAALQMFVPGRAARLGAVIKGIAAVLGIGAAYIYFSPFSALILAFFVFRGGASPIQEYRRSFDVEHQRAVADAVALARSGRLEDALSTLDASSGVPRSRDLQNQADGLKTTLLYWTGDWGGLAALPDSALDERTRGLALMRSGQLARAESVIRSMSPGAGQTALLAEVLARQDIDPRTDPAVTSGPADALVDHARTLVRDSPPLATELAEVAIDAEHLSPANRTVALILAGRFDDARVVARDIGPDAVWFIDAVDLVAADGDVVGHLSATESSTLVGSLQILLHQLGEYPAAIHAGKRALELGGDLAVIGLNIACSAVRNGDERTGLDYIEAVVAGGLDPSQIVADDDFASLRGTEAFASALGEPGAVGSADA